MPAATRCWSCEAEGLEPFYAVSGIPVHSVLLMHSREQAVGYPRGDLDLGFCPSCGFIQNTKFDPGVHEYSPQYEETQGFSPTFNEFARKLARTWIERHDLRNKEILEIGCGKGEFLVLLCEMGPNRGIGIDPSYVPERLDGEAASRIRFIQDLYSEKYAHLDADFVCCRHTLEHIQPALEFMKTIRRAIGDRPKTTICFELPDVYRVLKDQAFWDIYYEHCSYFSLGSLARLFRRSGFEVLDLAADFGDQYLLIDARVSDGGAGKTFPVELDIEELTAAVRRFRREVPRTLERWRKELESYAERGQRVAIWGSGSKAVAFLTTLGVTDEVAMVTDINPYRHGKYMPGTGHRIVPPGELAQFRPDVVVVMNSIYLNEIRADLVRMGLEPELLPL